MSDTSQLDVSWIYLAISLVGLILLPLILLNPPQGLPYTPLTRQVVGSIFIGICIFGILAATSPHQCKKLFASRTKQTRKALSPRLHSFSTSAPRRGHHPTCYPFATHTLQLRHHTLCAGCTGLSIGAVIGIAGSISYFLFGNALPVPTVLFVVGFFGTIVGLTQHTLYRYLPIQRGIIRTIINAFYVTSVLFLLSTTDWIAHSLLLDFYLLLLTIYWVNTRIIRSQTEHDRICQQCLFPACKKTG